MGGFATTPTDASTRCCAVAAGFFRRDWTCPAVP
jgi:hypothetical protein